MEAYVNVVQKDPDLLVLVILVLINGATAINHITGPGLTDVSLAVFEPDHDVIRQRQDGSRTRWGEGLVEGAVGSDLHQSPVKLVHPLDVGHVGRSDKHGSRKS